MNLARLLRWCPPSAKHFKLNTYASLNTRHDYVGVGHRAVIKDHRGLVNAASSQWIDMRFMVEIAKAVAVLRGIVLAMETGVVPIVFELDTLCGE
ncbi:hypothetical protein QYF36_016998 [Acer negundo]|nr:hypothetical protein QYF36_016998 [Acer negundo]